MFQPGLLLFVLLSIFLFVATLFFAPFHWFWALAFSLSLAGFFYLLFSILRRSLFGRNRIEKLIRSDASFEDIWLWLSKNRLHVGQKFCRDEENFGIVVLFALAAGILLAYWLPWTPESTTGRVFRIAVAFGLPLLFAVYVQVMQAENLFKRIQSRIADVLASSANPACKAILFRRPVFQLGHEEKERRLAALQELGETGHFRAVGPLILAYQANDKEVAAKAQTEWSTLLSRLGWTSLNQEAAVRTMLEAAQSDDVCMRESAATALADVDTAESREALAKLLEDPVECVRVKAALSLAFRRDKRAAGLLLQFVKNGQPDVYEQSTAFNDLRAEACRFLGRLEDKQAVEPLLKIFKSYSEPPHVRIEAAKSLGLLGDASVASLLIEKLAEKPLFDAAYNGLACRTDEETKTLIIKALNHANPDVQLAAGSLLGSLANQHRLGSEGLMALRAHEYDKSIYREKYLEEFVEDLSDARDAAARAEAARQLGKKKDLQAVEPLIKALEDSHMEVCISAIRALAALKDSRAIEPIVRRLSDKEEEIREEAIEALSGFGASACEAVVPLLRNQQSLIRAAAVNALEKIGDDRAVPEILPLLRDSDSRVCSATIYALGRWKDKRAVEPLIDLLRHGDERIRLASVIALGWICDPAAVEPVAAMLKDENGGVRETAAAALRNFKDDRAIPFLIAALQDDYPRVIVEAAKTLGELRATNAVEELIKLKDDNDSEVREEVLKALKLLGYEPAPSRPSAGMERMPDGRQPVRLRVENIVELSIGFVDFDPGDQAEQMISQLMERWNGELYTQLLARRQSLRFSCVIARDLDRLVEAISDYRKKNRSDCDLVLQQGTFDVLRRSTGSTGKVQVVLCTFHRALRDKPSVLFSDVVLLPAEIEAGRLQFGDGTNFLIFPSGWEQQYENHLKLVRHLKSAGVYPALKVFALKAARADAVAPRLLVLTGAIADTQQLDKVFYTREAESFVQTQCRNDWNAITPRSSVANVAMPGMTADLSKFNEILHQIEENYFETDSLLN